MQWHKVKPILKLPKTRCWNYGSNKWNIKRPFEQAVQANREIEPDIYINSQRVNGLTEFEGQPIEIYRGHEESRFETAENRVYVQQEPSVAELSQLPYYLYKGIADLEEAKIAWAGDQPELFPSENKTIIDDTYLRAPCGSATSIACGTTTVSGSTVGAGADSAPFCGTSDGFGGAVWYTIVGNGLPITVSTCAAGTDYDTKLRVYTGGCGALSCVTGNDDDFGCGFSSLRSTVSWPSTFRRNILSNGPWLWVQ